MLAIPDDLPGAASHPFDQAMAMQPSALDVPGAAADSLWQGQPHPGYQNMIGPYGGITAAQALRAVMLHPQRLGEPVALTVNFASAVDASLPFWLEALPVRTNRSTQHWTLRMWQKNAAQAGYDTVLTGTAVSAVRRQTWSAADVHMPAVPAPSDLERVHNFRGMEWIKRYDFRLCSGSLPQQWDGAEADSMTQIWLRDEPPRPLDFCSLTACADAFFPRVWRRRALLTPAGTVSMTVYFHASADELAQAGSSYLFGQARAQSFFNGYFDQSAELWSESSHLLATTHQIVYFKE